METYDDKIKILELEKKRKAQSTKRMLLIYCMIMLPLCIIAQVIITSFGSPIQLPLEILCGGFLTLMGCYMGVNFLQKKFVDFDNNNGGA